MERALRLFTRLDAAAYQAIISAAQEKRFWRDQTIFFEGDPVRDVFVLLSGCIKLTQTGTRGNEVILRLTTPGDVLGGVFNRAYGQCCTARALRPSASLVWDVRVFEALLERFPVFRQEVTYALEERLSEMEQRFWEASTQTTESRLSSELLRLTSRLERSDTKQHKIVLSHAELAQLTGTGESTVSRLLRLWEARGIVAVQRRAVTIQNSDALARLAESE
jgi:CRP/FNR family transcriptional regulator, nitrogen oxide reductase regulator